MGVRSKKYIFVTGGVISSLGKGIAAASIGALMENRGISLTLMKLDPYLNVDPGTMSPFQHGEVFVTDDGAETDLDLGHYERYTNVMLTKNNSKTAGQIYQSVLDKERRGDYLGKTVQVIPHVTDEIKSAIRKVAENHDLIICEVGGTVGDIESLPFLEAIRQMRLEEGPNNVLSIHVSYVPYIGAAGEVKTKPTQHSVKELRGIGIQPEVLLLRSDHAIDEDVKKKISLFCNVPTDAVINCIDVPTTYEVPLALWKEGLDDIISERLNIWSRSAQLSKWEKIVDGFKNSTSPIDIGIVGKYVDLVESYKSINEALVHAGIQHQKRVQLVHVDSEEIESKGASNLLGHLDAVLVPGGFGERGTEGKIAAVQYAREHNVPYFGICLGLQIAVIEFARNVAGIQDAVSEEFAPKSSQQVIHIMEHQKSVTQKGASMRLGGYPCILEADTLAFDIYQQKEIRERHRHRFEVNNDFREQLQKSGMVFSGLSPDGQLVEMVEISDHPFFLGCQFHPEFLSRPWAAHPIFAAFVKAAITRRHEKNA